MRIGVIGAGYVGIVAGACLAEMGNSVVVTDRDTARIEMLREGRSPHYEPGLDEMLMRNKVNKRLSFARDTVGAVAGSELVFIAVGTPSAADGSVDMSAVEAVVAEVGGAMDGYRLVVVKSTVPPGSNRRLAELLARHTEHEFDLVSNPEFLKEGTAISDFMHPDRVVVGARTDRARDIMRRVYNPFFRTGYRLMETDPESAEMIKYTSNVMLAARISLMNEISGICQAVGADVERVRVGVGLDRRIGTSFLFPGLGFGGSCFPKDVLAMVRLADGAGLNAGICQAVHDVNMRQKAYLLPFVEKEFGADLRGRVFAFFGLSYKPRTDDVRESPALWMADLLMGRGAAVRGLDPEAGLKAKKALPGLEIVDRVEDGLAGADALFLCTEWNEFRSLDWRSIKGMMRRPLVFDGRNIYEPEEMAANGFTYYSVGRNPFPAES